MNEEIFAGQWRQLKGTLRSWWGNLSDDDLEWVAGQKDRLVGLIQEKYGWTRDQAQAEVDRRFREYQSSDVARNFDSLKEKTYALGANAASKAQETASAAADKLATARSYVRENRIDEMAGDLGAIIRKYPVQSLLVGLGLIYVLARRRA